MLLRRAKPNVNDCLGLMLFYLSLSVNILRYCHRSLRPSLVFFFSGNSTCGSIILQVGILAEILCSILAYHNCILTKMANTQKVNYCYPLAEYSLVKMNTSLYYTTAVFIFKEFKHTNK